MTIQSVNRAFAILRAVADNPQGIGVSELARRMNLHKSTVSRLLSTLEGEDAVERLPNNNGFRIGAGLISLIPTAHHTQHLADLLSPFVHQLAEITGESVGLSVLNDLGSITAFQVPSRHTVQVQDSTGIVFPLHVTSSGKHYLANLTEVKLRSYLSKSLEKYTPKSITEPARLRERLVRIRRQGYDWTYDEFEEGLVACSAPIFNNMGRVVATLFITAPSFRFPADKEKQVTRWLVDLSQRATQLVCGQAYILSG